MEHFMYERKYLIIILTLFPLGTQQIVVVGNWWSRESIIEKQASEQNLAYDY